MFARSRGLVGDGPGAAAPSRRDGMGWDGRIGVGRDAWGRGDFPAGSEGDACTASPAPCPASTL